MEAPELYTIGHSNRTLEEFLEILKAHGIGRVVDVRTVPKSRRVPWFNKEELAPALSKAGIQYAHLPELGGLRHSRKDSTNLGWKNASFRGFADYMATPKFETGLEELNRMLPDQKTAIMCAEAVPWRCHRSLIADAETARNIPVEHLMSSTTKRRHTMTAFAVPGTGPAPRITYPATAGDPTQLELPSTRMPEKKNKKKRPKDRP